MLTTERDRQQYEAGKSIGRRQAVGEAFTELMKHSSTTMSELSESVFGERLRYLANHPDLGAEKVGRKWDVNKAIGYEGGGAGYGLFVRKEDAVDTIRKAVQHERLLRSLRKLADVPEQSQALYSQPYLENDPEFK